MPKYTFRCSNGHDLQKIVPSSVSAVSCPVCKEDMLRLMPKLAGQSDIVERKSSITGIQTRPDLDDQVKHRRSEYYWTIEVPRLVASDQYSLESMLENDWVYYDDKGQLQIRNKPPTKD